MERKSYDIENYSYDLTEKIAQIIDDYKRYDVSINIYENNEDVIKDFPKLRKLKKKYKKVKIKIIYSPEYIKKHKKKQILLNIIKLVLILIIICTIIYFLMFFIDQNNSQKLTENIKKYKVKDQIPNLNVQSDEEQEIITTYNKAYSKMFSDLKQINSETVGWLTVNGTNIDYPVVKHSDNDYYLNKDFENNTNRYGWVFMDYRNSAPNLGKNTIIYGHDSGGVMFANLYKVLYRNWYTNKKNQIITFNTENESSKWQIFSIYKIDTTNDYLKVNFNGNEFLDFVNMIKGRSIYDFNVDVNNNDQILTLSTCHGDTQRLVVHAKKI